MFMRQVLEIISGDPALEARWLNTLSLLEHIGSRKISKSVCETHPTLEVLEHFADETRHAYVFKKLSRGVSRSAAVAKATLAQVAYAPTLKSSDEEYLCRDEAISYFQMLDNFMSEWIRGITGKDDSYQNYLLVTCMIERRAMKLYPLYKSITQDREVKAELQKIIFEETNHRQIIEEKIEQILREHQTDLSPCLEIEEHLFGSFQFSLKKNLVRSQGLVHSFL